ncbi:MAG: AAA family ATPase [Desulfobacterales bacterium]|nr:AAA family ATPase [Desulfobacterales bacterium]
MKKHIPYGIANYEELVRKNAYFVDKTQYIENLNMWKTRYSCVPNALENPCGAGYWNVVTISGRNMSLKRSSDILISAGIPLPCETHFLSCTGFFHC